LHYSSLLVLFSLLGLFLFYYILGKKASNYLKQRHFCCIIEKIKKVKGAYIWNTNLMKSKKNGKIIGTKTIPSLPMYGIFQSQNSMP